MDEKIVLEIISEMKKLLDKLEKMIKPQKGGDIKVI